ncbi:MAG: low affinity iron permease family protein [Chloroflexota bacterium]
MASGGQAQSSHDRFNRLADRANAALGSLQALVLSILVVLVWALTGPVFGFSDTWQLVINTGTTVVTFWMVFVIQNSQNRNARAIHLKLDEIIRATETARNEFIVTQEKTEEELAEREAELRREASLDPAVGTTQPPNDGT